MARESFSRTRNLEASLLIGVPAIDSEHRKLFDRLDRLIADPKAPPESEAFSSVLSELGMMLLEHFRLEETQFQALGMPQDLVRDHLQAHTEIIDQYTQLNLDLMHGKSVDRTEALRMIQGWVLGHVAHHDLLIKDYLPNPPPVAP